MLVTNIFPFPIMFSKVFSICRTIGKGETALIISEFPFKNNGLTWKLAWIINEFIECRQNTRTFPTYQYPCLWLLIVITFNPLLHKHNPYFYLFLISDGLQNNLSSEKFLWWYLAGMSDWNSCCFLKVSFNPFPNKPWFLHVCSTCLLKTLWEKEKLLVTSNISFSHSVF